MNSLVVPPSPNWYCVQILTCTPDNTLIYGSKNDLVVIHPTPKDEPVKVRFIDKAHGQRVISVDCNAKWGSPNKWIVSSGDDNFVKLWDIANYAKISSHEAHKEHKDKLVGACFLTEDRILSVSESGTMFIWHPSTRDHTKLSNFFGSKVSITCFSPCPHASYITAFGLKNGLIIVANLKKNGSILHKLRGHTSDLVSLSWCPAPINVFPSKPTNYIKGCIDPNKNHGKPSDGSNGHVTNETELPKIIMSDESSNKIKDSGDKDVSSSYDTAESSTENATTEDSMSNISQSPENINKTVIEKKNDIWMNLKYDDDDENCDAPRETSGETSEKKEETGDFLTECNNLKKKIEQLRDVDDGEKIATTGENDSEIKREDSNVSEKQKEEEIRNIGEEQNSLGADSINKTTVNEQDNIEMKTSETKGEANKQAKIEVIPNKIVEEEPKKEFLLASSGKDSTVYIWRAGTDGRMQCFFRLPEKKIYSKKGNKGKEISWNVLKWITPFNLLCSIKKGELLKYILPKPLKSKNEYTLVHNEHNSLVFAIAANVPILTEENWLSKYDVNLWTFGHDMYLLNTFLDNGTSHTVALETFCALIQCFAQSPLDPSRLAIGISNGSIKVWNTNDTHVKTFSTLNFAPKIFCKITSLAWHPSNELLLAFSTEEGTIGFINTNKPQRASWFKQTFSNTVHKIQWGPTNQNKDKIGLYAVGEGKLLCFDPDKTNDEPQEVGLPTNAFLYTFAWKLDKSLLLATDTSGKLIFFDSHLSVKATYYQKKKSTVVAWHPDSENSGKESDKSYWVAATVDSVVYVYDFSDVSEKNGTLDIQDAIVAELEGHQANVKCLAWSPFNADLLVTLGEDCLALVWNVSTKEIVSVFHCQNYEHLKSIIWSPNNEDILITATLNASMILWKMSEHPGPLDQETLSKCKSHMKSGEKKTASTKNDESPENLKKMKKASKTSILPAISFTNDSAEEKVKALRDLLEWKESDVKKTNGVANIKQLFGNKEDVLKLMSYNESSHSVKGRHDLSSMVSFWKGDLQNSIGEAISQRRVTPLLISLAPTVSISLWQRACETYALQLEERKDGDPFEIATYYMACQNIEKAVECLCEKEMFKEALALAKCRLPEDNVFVEQIINKWATFSAFCGSLEIAAQCYIVLGQYEEAVKVLFRRSEPEILKFALDLAKKTNNDDLKKAVEFRCKAFNEEGGNSSAQDVENVPEMSVDIIKNTDNDDLTEADSSTKYNENAVEKDEETLEKGNGDLVLSADVGEKQSDHVSEVSIENKIEPVENDGKDRQMNRLDSIEKGYGDGEI